MSGTLLLMASMFPAAASGAPTLVSSTINAAGTTLTDVYSASVTNGAGGSGGKSLTMSGGASAPTYSSGSGSTTLVYTLGRTIGAGETGTSGYTQPGNGIEATTGGADVVTYSGSTITNNSTVASQVALVGTVTAFDSTTGTVTKTVAAGNTLILHLAVANNHSYALTITDTQSGANTDWLSYGDGISNNTVGGYRVRTPKSTAGSITITVGTDGGASYAGTLMEVANANSIDGVDVAHPSATSPNSGTPTNVAAANELILACCAAISTDFAGSFTYSDTFVGSSSNVATGRASYVQKRVNPSTGVQSAMTFTYGAGTSGTDGNTNVSIINLKG